MQSGTVFKYVCQAWADNKLSRRELQRSSDDVSGCFSAVGSEEWEVAVDSKDVGWVDGSETLNVIPFGPENTTSPVSNVNIFSRRVEISEGSIAKEETEVRLKFRKINCQLRPSKGKLASVGVKSFDVVGWGPDLDNVAKKAGVRDESGSTEG